MILESPTAMPILDDVVLREVTDALARYPDSVRPEIVPSPYGPWSELIIHFPEQRVGIWSIRHRVLARHRNTKLLEAIWDECSYRRTTSEDTGTGSSGEPGDGAPGVHIIEPR